MFDVSPNLLERDNFQIMWPEIPPPQSIEKDPGAGDLCLRKGHLDRLFVDIET